MKVIKKNQFIIYILAIMLMTVGYLNFTSNIDNNSVETSLQMEAKDDSQLADIGDATLVSSNYVAPEGENEGEEIEDKEAETNIDIMKQVNNEYFIKSKLERETMYSQMIETYEKILNSNNASETQKQSATQEITKINETKNRIMICENLIKTKGFENSIIFVNGDSISVIIGGEEIKTEEVAQIQNIISREMKVGVENIHISTK